MGENPEAGLLRNVEKIMNKRIKDLENKIGRLQKDNADIMPRSAKL